MCGNASNLVDTNRSGSSSIESKTKNALGNRFDIWWKHGFDINGNGRKVKCNYCSKIVSGGIFRFKHHLVGTRKDFEPCASISEEIKNLMIKIVVEAKHAALKRRKLNEEDEESESVEGWHKLFGFKGKQTIANASKGEVQTVDISCLEWKMQRNAGKH